MFYSGEQKHSILICLLYLLDLLQRVKELFGDEPPAVVMADFVRPDPAFLGLIRNHLVDPLYYLCGVPDQIVAVGNMADEAREGNTVASMRFKGGSLGSDASDPVICPVSIPAKDLINVKRTFLSGSLSLS